MKQLGVATIIYDEQGNASLASFNPTLPTNVGTSILKTFKNIGNNDLDVIKQNADLTLAAWFSEVTNIELADRTKYEIVSEVLECEKFPNGNIKMCKISYTFKEL